MHRDMKMYWHRLSRYVINDALIRPILYSIVFAYVMPYVTVQAIQPGAAYVGSLLYLLMPILFGLNIDYLLDIEREKSILYKLTILPARYIIAGRVVLTSVISTLAVLGAFPLAYCFIGARIGITMATIIPLCVISFASSLCISAIVLCFMSGMKGLHQSHWFWRRFVYPLVMFGGFLAPWHIMAKASHFFGHLVLINPLIYVSEGMRNALFGAPYILWYYCVPVLLIYAILFMVLACYLLKKNIDYV